MLIIEFKGDLIVASSRGGTADGSINVTSCLVLKGEAKGVLMVLSSFGGTTEAS